MLTRFAKSLNTFFNSEKTLKKSYHTSEKILHKYPHIISIKERDKLLEASQKSQSYFFSLSAYKNPYNTKKVSEDILKKYNKKITSEELDNTLKLSEINKKYSSIY